MSTRLKKQLILNLPYFLIGLYATKLGEAWRLAEGADASQKFLHLMDGFTAAREILRSQPDPALRPKIYMWCGTEDFLYAQNTRMRDHLRALGYDLTYEESPGDHQWRYWDQKIADALAWLLPEKGENAWR